MLSVVYSAWQARVLGLKKPAGTKLWRRPDIALIRPHLPYAILVLIVSLVTTTLFSFDIIAVKHYFPADVAGHYAGIATIARIIYFLTGSISAVLLSTVKLEASSSANRALLTRSAILQTLIGGGALAIFATVPTLITRILIGSRYVSYAYLLPRLSLALFILAFVSLLFNYDLALRRASAAVVSVVGSLAMLTIVILHHATLSAVVDSLVWGSVVILALRGLDSASRLLRSHA